MTIYYNAGRNAFYDDDVCTQPEGSVEISAEQYNLLMELQCGGRAKILPAEDGTPYIENIELEPCTCPAHNTVFASTTDAGHVRFTASGPFTTFTSMDGNEYMELNHTYMKSKYVTCGSASNNDAQDIYGAKTFKSRITAGYGFTCTNAEFSESVSLNGGARINGTDVDKYFGAALATTDDKRIVLRSKDGTGLSNFDPKEIIANVLQGLGYGSTTPGGAVGAISIFAINDIVSAEAGFSGEVAPGTKISSKYLHPVRMRYDQQGAVKLEIPTNPESGADATINDGSVWAPVVTLLAVNSEDSGRGCIGLFIRVE